MVSLLKKSWSLYIRNFKIIFGVMLPAIIIIIPVMVYLESLLGLKTGTPGIPSDISSLASVLILPLIFLGVLIWSQFALSEGIQNKGVGVLGFYRSGLRKLPTVFKKIKFLWKIFAFRHLLFLFIIWFIFNGSTANILERLTENLWIEQTVFVFLNFLLLIPFFHMYGFSLYKNLRIRGDFSVE